MTKLCECGCGQPAPICNCTDRRYGLVKGQPSRFIRGHNNSIKNTNHRKHGMSCTPEYYACFDAKYRCTNPKDKYWKDYGGRGIEFRFTSFEEFFAELGTRPTPAHSLDRIDNNGHYEPGNVRWATKAEQNANRRVSLNASYKPNQPRAERESKHNEPSSSLIAA